MATNEVLMNIFSESMSSDNARRRAAEQALGQLSADTPDLVVYLIRFACQYLPPTELANPHNRNAFLAAAIRVRNALSQGSWRRPGHFSAQVREEVKELLVHLQCEAHVSERIRRQLLEAAEELMRCDFPARWPALVPQLGCIIDRCCTSLRYLEERRPIEPTEQALLQLRGALGLLRACCKLQSDPTRVTIAEADAFALQYVPSLVVLHGLLLRLLEAEARRLAADASTVPADPLLHRNPFEFTPLLSELAHCMRLSLKCCWSLLESRWPKVLCKVELFREFYGACLAQPTRVMHEVLQPLCRARLVVLRHTPGSHTDDYFSSFQSAAVWRMLKWCQTITFKLVQEFISPRSCEKRVRPVATVFASEYLLPAVEMAWQLVEWHAEPQLLTSKAYIMALEIMSCAAGHRESYQEVLHPRAEATMTMLLFPRLAFNEEDAELWGVNPEEYVRRQTSPKGDLFSAKVVSTSLLLALAVPTQPFHDQNLLGCLVNFLVNQLQMYSGVASQATATDAMPQSMEAARRVDAALFCFYEFKRVLLAMAFGDEKVEELLTYFVVPAAAYPLGFLRARAVLVLSVFAPSIAWSSAEAYQAALRAVLPLLNDPEAPVRVQACVSFSRLVRHPHARAVITPCIAALIQQYFEVMRLMDNEAVVRTLRKTILYYHDTLSQWALQLAELIVQHFAATLHTVTGKYQELEAAEVSLDGSGAPAAGGGDKAEEDDGDELADTLMAADELLATLTTLTNALPPSALPRWGAGDDDSAARAPYEADMFVQLQYRLAPMLLALLSRAGGSSFGFVDPTLQLLTTLLARSPAVAPPLWQLIPCFLYLVQHGATDYFSQMLAPLDNYSSVEPLSFALTPLQALCAVPASAMELAALTPLQVIGQAAEVVLHSESLRNQEVAAVPKLYDAVLQNYWAAVRSSQQPGSVARPSAAGIVHSVARQMLLQAGTRPRQSNSLRVLFANSLLSCMLADAEATVGALADLHAISSFYEQYVYLTNLPAMQQQLRSYDRSLFVLAFIEAVCLLGRVQAAGQWSSTHEVLQAALIAVVRGGYILRDAEREAAVAAAELDVHRKRLARDARRAAKAKAGVGEAEEWSDMEGSSASSGSSSDDSWPDGGDDWEGSFAEEEEDDGADDTEDDDGDEGLDTDEMLSGLARQAAAARGGGTAAHGLGEEDGAGEEDDEEEDLLEEEGFDSPIDAVNAWRSLSDLAADPAVASVAVVQCLCDGSAEAQAQAAAVVRANAAVAELMAVREERARATPSNGV